MNRPKLAAFALTAWLVIEVIAFVLVVRFLGMLAAIALGVGTTLLGLADIKRLLVYLRSRIGRPKAQVKAPGKGGGHVVDGALQALGSLLLILPGFASDLVGLALKAPSIRAGVADRLRDRDKTRKGPRTIDLAPNEWKSLKHQRKKRSRGTAG